MSARYKQAKLTTTQKQETTWHQRRQPPREFRPYFCVHFERYFNNNFLFLICECGRDARYVFSVEKSLNLAHTLILSAVLVSNIRIQWKDN